MKQRYLVSKPGRPGGGVNLLPEQAEALRKRGWKVLPA